MDAKEFLIERTRMCAAYDPREGEQWWKHPPCEGCPLNIETFRNGCDLDALAEHADVAVEAVEHWSMENRKAE